MENIRSKNSYRFPLVSFYSLLFFKQHPLTHIQKKLFPLEKDEFLNLRGNKQKEISPERNRNRGQELVTQILEKTP
jgi:hypothetical protein